MRVKNTLFTAIAAGIVFLSGMVILGKNTLTKKEHSKKDYTPINNTHNTAHEKVKVDIPVNEKGQKTQGKDEHLLLQMVNEMLQARNTNAVNFGMRKVVSIRGEGRVVSNDTLHRRVTIQDQKSACKIREPSGSLSMQVVNRSGMEEDIDDKGG